MLVTTPGHGLLRGTSNVHNLRLASLHAGDIMRNFKLNTTQYIVARGVYELLRDIRQTPLGNVWVVRCELSRSEWFSLGISSIGSGKAYIVCDNRKTAISVAQFMSSKSGKVVKANWWPIWGIVQDIGNDYEIFMPYFWARREEDHHILETEND